MNQCALAVEEILGLEGPVQGREVVQLVGDLKVPGSENNGKCFENTEQTPHDHSTRWPAPASTRSRVIKKFHSGNVFKTSNDKGYQPEAKS